MYEINGNVCVYMTDRQETELWHVFIRNVEGIFELCSRSSQVIQRARLSLGFH